MSLANVKAEDRRREILCLLAADSQEAASADVLHRALNSLGPAFRASDSQVRADISWLAQHGLVETEELRHDVIVATLTREGRDVAAGDIVVPGVSRRPRGR